MGPVRRVAAHVVWATSHHLEHAWSPAPQGADGQHTGQGR